MKFSIVLPTYRRADKLKLSLSSALGQEFDDYEIVVSNNGADPETRQCVQSTSSDRIRYVETDTVLSMVDHWEFALSHARGEWVLMLCDDDALLSKCLEFLSAIIDQSETEIVFYDLPTYVYGDGVQDDGDFLNVGPKVPFTTKQINSRRQLKKCFWQLSGDMPKLLNCAVHHDLLDRLREKYGSVFGRWAPDYSVGSRLLANTSHYVKTGPLGLWGENMASYGSGAQQDPEHCLSFFRQFPEFDGTLQHFPYPKLFCVTAIIYDTLCIVRDELGCRPSELRIDEAKLRGMILTDLDRYEKRGHHQFSGLRDQISRDRGPFQRRHFFHPGEASLILALRCRRQWEKSAERRMRKRRRAIAGNQQKQHFGNILEAAECVSNRLVQV